MNKSFDVNNYPYPEVQELDARYPCPDFDCDGLVYYETTGYWQCEECSFRQKHIPNDVATLMGWRL